MIDKFNLRRFKMQVASIFNPYIKPNIESVIETVSTQRAQDMLNQSKGNRKIREAHVNWLSTMIENNTFTTTHQGIAFDKNGTLIDGHHRLLAIIRANKPVKIMVTYGLESVYDNIDQGANRSNSDILDLDPKISIPLTVAADIYYGRKKAIISEIRDLIDTKLYKAICEVAELQKTNVKYFTSANSRLAVAILLIDDEVKDKQYVKDQYIALCAGNFEAMSEYVRAFFKSTYVNGAVDSKRTVFTKTLKALDPSNKNLTKMVLRSDSVETATLKAKNIINTTLFF
jgi:hypothetical protein